MITPSAHLKVRYNEEKVAQERVRVRENEKENETERESAQTRG